MFQHVVETRPTALKGLRHLLSGGDVLSPTHVRTLLELGVAVTNGYGPTECTTFSTVAHLSLDDTKAALHPWVTGGLLLAAGVAAVAFLTAGNSDD